MISDDDLILYYYRDGLDDAERARIGTALAEQPELAQRLHRLVARLDAVAASPEVPVPAQFQKRWSAALEKAALIREVRQAESPRDRFRVVTWLSAAAVMVLAISAVINVTRKEPAELTAGTAQPSESAAANPAETSAYERGLQSHLANTERQLASLDNVTPEERERLINMIIDQNRIYARAADKAGEPQLARVLRAFSPVLESLRHGGGDASGSVDQLAFELRVMQGRLGAAPAAPTQSTTL